MAIDQTQLRDTATKAGVLPGALQDAIRRGTEMFSEQTLTPEALAA